MLTESTLKPTRIRLLSGQRGWVSPAALAVSGVIGSLAIGLLASKKAEYAVVALVGIALLVVAWRTPRTIVVLAAVSFIWAPEDIFGAGFGNYPQAQKLLILFAGLLLGRKRGFRFSFAAPVFAYLALALIITPLGSTHAVGLTPYQTFLSLLTLIVCWILFAVNWRREDALHLLKVFTWLPLVALAFGLLLYSVHKWDVIDTTVHPPRLQGALIAPYFAAAAAAGTVAALMLHRITRWRYGATLTILNAALLALTLTRGAMIAGGVALIPSAVRLVRSQRVRTPVQLARVVIVIAIAVAAIVFVSNQIATRDSQTIFVPGQGEVKGDISSGRTAAWAFAYEQAKANLVFGRGLGSAPVIGAHYQHFLAQHNEFLRMLLEGGYAGGVLILLSIVGAIVWAVSRSPTSIRVDLAFFAAGVAVYSFTDNTLSNPQFALPMTLIFAFGAALGERPVSSRPLPSLTSG